MVEGGRLAVPFLSVGFCFVILASITREISLRIYLFIPFLKC